MSSDSNFLILLVPFVAFVVFFSSILIIRTVCGSSRRKSNWATQRIRRRHVSVASSSSSVEVQTAPAQFVPPPRYYPPEVTATESSAMYPVIVPYYNNANQASLRDPRQFQGLPGLVAPPPYPEPPSYSQISSYPDMPLMSRLEQNPPSRQGQKKGDPIAPVE